MVEHRQSFRYPAHLADREAVLFGLHDTIDAAIIDASEGGVGVIVPNDSSLSVGTELGFEERDSASSRRTVRVTFVEPTTFDVLRVGLIWV